jgi:hypothetical protein
MNNQNGSTLLHYGVKGMRWGVRRYQNYDGTRLHANPGLRPGDMVLPKGTKFQRIATSGNMANTTGVYLAYKTGDKDLYRGMLGRARLTWMIKNEPGQVQLKQLTMTANKEIKIPSMETRMSEMRKLVTSDRDAVVGLINESREINNRSGRYNSYSLKESDINQTMYQRFNDALALGTNSTYGHVIAKYYDSLRKQGYDAIPDENDIRFSARAKAPVILFNTMDSIGSTKVKNLTAGEVLSAYNRTIGEAMVKRVLVRPQLARENLKANTDAELAKAFRQQQADKYSLNKSYTLDNLGTDWGINRLSSRQIRKVSELMDAGKSHAEASAEVIDLRNSAVDKVLSRYKL